MLVDFGMPTTTSTKTRKSTKPRSSSQPTPPRAPSDDKRDETLAFLALSCIKGVSYWTLWKLRQKGQTFAQVLNEPNDDQVRRLLKDAGAQLAKANQNGWAAARDAIIRRARTLSDELTDIGVRVVHRGDYEYPAHLNDLADPPFWLFVQGSIEVLSQPAITIVGTREPSEDGLWLTRFVGGCLHELRCATVSGLATGIDQLVHKASIRANVPTIAILGNGVFTDFPKGSGELRSQIVAQGGAVITEYLPQQSYSAENFVRRNRLQAALGGALVPAEWAARSGTAHTVKYAADLKRPIACLRMPDWPEDRVPFTAISGSDKKLFTVPGEEKMFRQFVEKALRSAKKKKRSLQPDFFARE